jgi:ribonuclease HI
MVQWLKKRNRWKTIPHAGRKKPILMVDQDISIKRMKERQAVWWRKGPGHGSLVYLKICDECPPKGF